MRSLPVVLALCLGLFAVAQALAPSPLGGVLLEGFTPIEESKAPAGNVSALHNHFWHRGPPHDPHDHHYWDRRHAAKDELFRCLGWAVRGFSKDHASTWKNAGMQAAQCILTHLGHCHDLPGVPQEITTFLPYVMFVNGLDTLVEEGNDGLLHAELVLQWYIAGGIPLEDNPFYIPPGTPGQPRCAAKLVSYLFAACAGSPDAKRLHALAKTVVKSITNPSNELAACLPDIPAVILALTSTYCPASPANFLYKPDGTAVRCTPTQALFEDRAGALLGGSLISLLLLSKNAVLADLGFQVAFAMNRMALAATQTTDFDNCLGDYQTGGGQLAQALGQELSLGVPANSGPFPGPLVGLAQSKTKIPLSVDGQRVLCGAIVMMGASGWNNNLLWQGTADAANAIAKTILVGQNSNPPTVVISDTEIAGLCKVTQAVWTFTDVESLDFTSDPEDLYVTINAAANGQFDLSCYTGGACTWKQQPKPARKATPRRAGNNKPARSGPTVEDWPFSIMLPTLDASHTMFIGSPSYTLCGALWSTGAKKVGGRRGL